MIQLMTKEEYKAAREARGTQKSVADALGVHRVTIGKREAGDVKITREAELALLQLPEKERVLPPMGEDSQNAAD